MRHRYACPTRWADLDLLGHVNNVAYLDYLQEARSDFLRHLGAGRPVTGDDEGIFVVRHEIQYVDPLGFTFDPVQVDTWVSEVRAASFTLAYEIFADEPGGGRRTFARAHTVLAPFDFRSARPRRLTGEERQSLRTYLEPAETPVAARATSSISVPPAARHGDDRVHHYPVHVRFSDIDAYRHVNNVTYLEYSQEARIRAVRAIRHRHDVKSGALVIARTDIDYLRQMPLRAEPYDAWTALVAVGNKSQTWATEICDGEQVLARVVAITCTFDLDAGRTEQPTPEWRAALEASLL